jgi:hypothetical protein
MRNLPCHPTMRHPFTGLPLQALGFIGGKYVWPIMGAAPDDDEENDKDAEDVKDNGTEVKDDESSKDDAQEVASLPQWAQDLIKKLRSGDAAKRVELKNLKGANQKQLDAIATALGLKPTDADPETLKKKLTESNDDVRATKIELAVYQAADDRATAHALLDSVSFRKSIEGLDTTADEFSTTIGDLVTEAAKKLPQKTKAGKSGGDFSGGTGTVGAITKEQLSKMTPAQIAKAYADGKLKHLM